MTTRRQHYVWRKYLEPWATPKGKARQIWHLRRENKQPVHTEIKNVAAQRDFYRLRDLEPGDVEFVRTVGIRPNTHPPAKIANERWISRFDKFLRLHHAARDLVKADPQKSAELDKELIEFQERDNARIENRAVPHLAALQVGDVSFFDNEADAMKFSYFLAHQYFRTKAMRDRIRNTFNSKPDKDRFDRTWPLFRYIFATNVGCEIFRHRKSVRLQVLTAAPGMEFITSDQPVINTYGAFVPERTAIEEVELFYPVSPTRAAVLSGHLVYQDMHGKALEPFRMHYLNQTIERIAYEQLFARSEDVLQALLPYFRNRSEN